MTDTTTPPGQTRYPEPPDHWRPPRYLRDEIARIQAQERLEGQDATLPLDNAKKRLEGLKTALLAYFEETNPNWNGWQDDIREILEQSEKST